MDEERIEELLLRWDDLRSEGREVSAEELCHGCPDLLEEVRRRLDNLKATEWMEDETAQVAEAEPTGPKMLGKYRLDERIGVGGFGHVWKAFDPFLERFVAIKAPRPERLASFERFIDEARKIARLRHSGIVAVHDFGKDGDTCFIVTELIGGGSLAERIESNRPDVSTSLKWVAQVADALHHAHQQGIVHRDVKPANILLGKDGTPVLTDFGIAVKEDETTKQSASTAGTLAYMSPEQIEGTPSDRRTDVYSLGVVLYQLLTGRLPYDGDSSFDMQTAILAARPKPPSQFNDQIPERVERICLKAMARNPADRYTTAKALAEDIRSYLKPRSPWRKTAVVTGILLVLFASSVGRWLWNARESARATTEKVEEQTTQVQQQVNSVLADVEKQYGVPIPSSRPQSPSHGKGDRKNETAVRRNSGLTIGQSTVDLSGQDLTAADFDQLGRHFTLRRLSLADTKTTDADLTRLRSVPGLERLDLNGTQITDTGIEMLNGFVALQYLSLDRTAITDQGMKRLGTMRLRQLSLANTKITDDGVKRLAERHGAADYLDELDLADTGITDACVPSLISMSRLARLVVLGTKLTNQGVKQLEMALPKCKVEH